ncbi:MAG: DUF3575 domain-containing protein [Flavobacteria bacterium RIFCSPLOWO2_12_FULL_35_11]|nr:MAG: DUF3575 domain-containing protein [Flavobacteria bacterium RIFCSPLOWO2_12_FULL_35_11]
MKKITLSVLLIIISISLFAQENDSRKNELKINMSNLIGFKWFDVSYERLINEESSFGVGTIFSLDNKSEGLDEYRTFSITPYYRQFFSSKYAEGFFVEAFTMLHSGKDYTYNYVYEDFPPYNTIEYTTEDKYTDLAVGISVGGKWVTKRGFVAEVYAGIGRDMLNQSDIEVVGRGGVSIGYRLQ